MSQRDPLTDEYIASIGKQVRGETPESMFLDTLGIKPEQLKNHDEVRELIDQNLQDIMGLDDETFLAIFETAFQVPGQEVFTQYLAAKILETIFIDSCNLNRILYLINFLQEAIHVDTFTKNPLTEGINRIMEGTQVATDVHYQLIGAITQDDLFTSRYVDIRRLAEKCNELRLDREQEWEAPIPFELSGAEYSAMEL